MGRTLDTLGAASIGALAFGALAGGAVAVGAMAAAGRLAPAKCGKRDRARIMLAGQPV